MGVDVDHAAAGGTWSQDWCRWEWRASPGWLHRLDGPAIVSHADGYQAWYQEGWPHRINGPAITFSNGDREWYVHGYEITHEVDAWMRDHGIVLPFTAEQAMEFQLKWG